MASSKVCILSDYKSFYSRIIYSGLIQSRNFATDSKIFSTNRLHPPKRASTAYLLFANAYRLIFKEQNPTSKFALAFAGQKWKELDEGAKKPYEDLAQKLSVEYRRQKEEYIKEYEEKMGPKRPKSGYLLFSQDVYESVSKENRGLKGVEVIKEIAKRWKALDPSTKQPYLDSAAKNQAEYKVKKEAFLSSLTPEQRKEWDEKMRNKISSKSMKAKHALDCLTTLSPKERHEVKKEIQHKSAKFIEARNYLSSLSPKQYQAISQEVKRRLTKKPDEHST